MVLLNAIIGISSEALLCLCKILQSLKIGSEKWKKSEKLNNFIYMNVILVIIEHDAIELENKVDETIMIILKILSVAKERRKDLQYQL